MWGLYGESRATDECEAFGGWARTGSEAKAIQRDEAKRNRAAFLRGVVRGDTSLLVRASFLCGDYKAKANH